MSVMKIIINKKLVIPYSLVIIFVILDTYANVIAHFDNNYLRVIFYNREKIASIILLIGFFFYERKLPNIHIKKYAYELLLALLLMFIYGLIVYSNQRMITTFGRAAWFSVPLISVIMLYIMRVEGNVYMLIHKLNIISIITIAIVLYCTLNPDKHGILTLFSNNDTLIFRGGKPYIGIGGTVGIVTVYNLYIVLFDRIKKYWVCSFIEIIFYFVYLMFVAQSRAYLVAFILTSMVFLYFSKVKMRYKILLYITSAVAVFFLLSSGFITLTLDSFSRFGENAGSTIARAGAYNYYLKKFISNPLFGIGFAGENEYYKLVHGSGDYILRGSVVNYRYSDVGIAGLLAQTGMFSVFVFIAPLMWMISVTKCYSHKDRMNEKALLLSIVAFVIATTPTLICTDPERCIGWGLVIAIFSYYEMLRKTNHQDSKNI